jgi:membrane fusion protein (multidrug efflux system)
MFLRRGPGAGVVLLILSLGIATGGCRSAQPAATQLAASPTVQVAAVERQDVGLPGEWIASIDGYVNEQIQPHVSGYLVRQNYKEGSPVRQGDVLFEIDPRPFQAALDQSRAQLAQAQAQLGQAQAQSQQTQAQIVQAQAQLAKAEQDVARERPLAEAKAIAQSRLDDDLQARAGAAAAVTAAQATASASQASITAATAAVGAARAAVEQAELNLGYTKITSLVSGIAGIAQAQIGDLVSTTTILTTVSQLDPVKVYFPISEQDYLRSSKATGPPLAGIPLKLILSDGSTFPQTGHVLWTDRQIDTSTGTIRLVASFANPGNVLRPGQYGRVQAITSQLHDALLVPQAAVTELQGNFQVAVVANDNKVEIRTIKLGPAIDGKWIVNEGVAFGERVVVGGLQYAQPGAVVHPEPATTKEK